MTWPDSSWISAYGQWAAVFVAVIGFVWVILQLQLGVKAATSQLYGNVTTAMASVNAVFQTDPAWHRYFLGGERPPPDDPKLHSQLLSACDVVMNFVDAIVEQKRALPDHVPTDWSTWETYIRDLYSRSPILQEYVTQNLRYFPDYTFAALGHLIVRDQVDGAWKSAWKVVEPELFGGPKHPGGYPWIRKWEFKQLEPNETLSVTADVTGHSTNEVHIKVGPISDHVTKRELCVIQYWIIGTMEGTGVKKVKFEYPRGMKIPEVKRYETGRLKSVDRTFAFLIPEYAALWPLGISREPWFGALTKGRGAPVPS